MNLKVYRKALCQAEQKLFYFTGKISCKAKNCRAGTHF